MPARTKTSATPQESSIRDDIEAYGMSRTAPFRAICDRLRGLINTCVPNATSKVWHGSPVWFLDDNPVVGYSTTAKSVNLLFWNGRALDEPALEPVGKHGAAHALFRSLEDLDDRAIKRWLKKAGANVFDSKAYFKNMREQHVAKRQ